MSLSAEQVRWVAHLARLKLAEDEVQTFTRQLNDIVARPKECEALVKAYEARAVCVANDFRCKIPHVKAFFAVLTDERNTSLFTSGEKEVIRQHVPWTRVVSDVRTMHDGKPVDLLAFIRNRQAYLSFTVDLMNSLGGGWVPST